MDNWVDTTKSRSEPVALFSEYAKVLQKCVLLRNAPHLAEAIRSVKEYAKSGSKKPEGWQPFKNEEGLQTPPAGYSYFEAQVGEAHAGGARPRGKIRLVFAVHESSGCIHKSFKFISFDHYNSFSHIA